MANKAQPPTPEAPLAPPLSATDTLLKIAPDLARHYSHAELSAHADSDLRLLASILMSNARLEKIPE